VTISDGALTGTSTATVTVLSALDADDRLSQMIADLVTSGAISQGNATSLTAKVSAAANQIENRNATAAVNQLSALLDEVDAMTRTGRLTAAQSAELRGWTNRLIAALRT
jgi:hypothetical protein